MGVDMYSTIVIFIIYVCKPHHTQKIFTINYSKNSRHCHTNILNIKKKEKKNTLIFHKIII